MSLASPAGVLIGSSCGRGRSRRAVSGGRAITPAVTPRLWGQSACRVRIAPIVRTRADNSPGTGQDTFSSSIGAPNEFAAPLDASGGSAAGRSKPGDRLSGDGENDWLTLTLLAAVAIFVCYADRSNISTAIIPMAKDFGWDKIQTGGVLSAFFYGYALTQLVGGRLADSFGGKRVLALGVLGWSLATFVTPLAAAGGAIPLVAARVTLGAGEGVAFPAVHSLISRHVPKDRQSTAVAAVTAASYGGAAFAFGVTPAVVLAGGWEAAFYTFGAAAIFWFPFWAASSFKVVNDAGGGGKYGADSAGKTGVIDEWLALVKTREVRAICVAQFAQSWGGYGLLSWLPTYFEEALGVPLGDLPAFTVLPYFIQGIVGVGSGVVADQWLREGKFSTKFIRRAFQTVGMVGPAVCLAGAAVLGGAGATDANVFATAVLVDVGLALSALTLAGVSVSHLDVAPRHAGLVFATGNTCATIAGIIAVPLSGWVLEATGQSWSAVFGVIAVLYVVGAALWWAWVGDEPVPEDSL